MGGGQEAPALMRDETGLSLVFGGLVLRGDFARLARRISPGSLNRELLVKAARVKGATRPLTCVDCTAGLGEDSFLLAASGFSVILFEHDESIAALLEDALDRGRADPATAEIVSRMTLVKGEAEAGLRGLGFTPDVIYLDPMFPAKRKDALAKKKLQLFQMLEAPCEDGAALVAAALAVHPRKVVIKRPAKGDWLAGIRPSYSIAGKTVRYDCLVP